MDPCRSRLAPLRILHQQIQNSWNGKPRTNKFSRSSCESEYRTLASTAAEVIWIQHLLRDLRISLSNPPSLLCDNKSALFISSNPVSHKHSKHIDLDYHFLWELVAAGKIQTQHIPSHLQITNVSTKSVSRHRSLLFRTKLRVCSNPTLGLTEIMYLQQHCHASTIFNI